MKKVLFTILGALIFSGLFAQEIPQKISYQGKLLENGSPVTGTKSITFTIGTWSETKNVQISDGLYSVTLGETTLIPTSIFDNTSTVELEISVEGTTLSPQTEILSVPYAYKAEKAVEAENVFSGNYNDLTNAPSNISEFTNDAGYITNPNDADADATNELQTLSINGSDLTIFGGNTVALPTGSSYTASNGISISSNAISMSGAYTGDFTVAGSIITGTPTTSFTNGFNGDIVADRHLAADEDIYAGGNIWGDDILADDDIMVDDDIWLGGEIRWNTGAYIDQNPSGTVKIYGNLAVTGSVSKSSGSFKIDHPLDPENKYLYHSFVESPDMMNVYNGNVILDNNGETIVTLPDYFEALNMEYRYQLTCIGSFAQVYISEEIVSNSFKISGGVSGLKVSWQVTGIRQDPYANQNRIQVEVEKTEEEKGHSLHYEGYNQPYKKSIESLQDMDSKTK